MTPAPARVGDREEAMAKIMIIGAGGVGNVVAKKCAMHPEVFGDLQLAAGSRPGRSV